VGGGGGGGDIMAVDREGGVCRARMWHVLFGDVADAPVPRESCRDSGYIHVYILCIYNLFMSLSLPEQALFCAVGAWQMRRYQQKVAEIQVIYICKYCVYNEFWRLSLPEQALSVCGRWIYLHPGKHAGMGWRRLVGSLKL